MAVRKRVIPKQRVALALGGVLLMLFAAVVYRVQTDQGTFVVTIEDPEVQAILQQDGLVIHDKTSDRSWTIKAPETKHLPSGEYQLRAAEDLQLLVTDDSGAEVKTDSFTLKRKGEVRVRVTLEPVARVVRPATALSTTSDADRVAAEWVLSVGGQVGFQVEGQERMATKLEELPNSAFSVSSISIWSGKIEDADLARLAGLEEMTRLALRDVPIRDAGLMHLRELSKLNQVMLRETKITGDGLKYLERSQGLVNLDLVGTNLGPTGLRHLGAFPDLQALYLDETPISDADIDVIVAHPRIRLLTIMGRFLADPNACLKKIANLNELEYLHFYGCQQAGEVGFQHFRRLTKMKTLQVSDTGFDDRSLAHLEPLQQLESINLNGTKVTNGGLPHLGKLPALRDVLLDGTSIDDDGLEQLAAVKQLKLLLIGRTKVSDAGLKHLRDYSELETLSFFQLPITDAGLAQLAGLTKLKTLHLQETKVTGDGVPYLNWSSVVMVTI